MRLNKDSLLQAKEYAFLLLKFRLRSEQELHSRLKRKKFSEEVIGQAIAFLKEKNFIDDNYFAKSWIDARLKRPLGLARIKQELRIKGVGKAIIDNQIDEVRKDYSEIDIVNKLAQDKMKRLKGIEPKKAKQRLYAYLLRRGFSVDVVLEVLANLLRPGLDTVGKTGS
ncbi:MAG: regulatory protein RecX [Candidatus Omnitrophica bacterium]|nr:regulatory protein RecX [Candidatus Omnitrophota bacterium]